MTLREILHAHIPVLSPSSTVRDAIDKMDIYQFPALVLLDEDKQVMGVITEGDICRAVSGIGKLSAFPKEMAADYASKHPKTAPPDMEISDALHLMLSTGITILPIVEDNSLLGVVLRVDLMQALLMDLAEESANSRPDSK